MTDVPNKRRLEEIRELFTAGREYRPFRMLEAGRELLAYIDTHANRGKRGGKGAPPRDAWRVR